MEIKQLITFQEPAESLNFTKTAKKLNFAQSSITSQIKALESHLGTKLFELFGKRIYLTEAGRKFKPYADHIIDLYDEAKSAIVCGDEPFGTLVVGAQESLSTYRLTPIIKKFKEKYSKVKFLILKLNNRRISRYYKHQLQSN